MKLTRAELKLRNKIIAEQLLRKEPDGSWTFTYQQIGDSHGLTRERIRQIGVKGGIADRHSQRRKENAQLRKAVNKNAPTCSVEHCNNKVKIVERPKLKYATSGRCTDHGRDMVLITCAWCGKKQERERYHVFRDHHKNALRKVPQTRWFCNNFCQGKFIGQEYGFAAHPENAGTKKRNGPMSGVTLEDLEKAAEKQ